MTSPIQGCGNQPIVGYTYCRKTEGFSADELLYFYGPPAQCSKPPCVIVKIYAPNGAPALSVPIKPDETRLALPWRDLIKNPTFRTSDRGMWLYCLDITFRGTDGIEHQSTTCGEIRLRVLAANYTPLHNQAQDANFTWIWCENQWTIKMTSSGRTFIGLCNDIGR